MFISLAVWAITRVDSSQPQQTKAQPWYRLNLLPEAPHRTFPHWRLASFLVSLFFITPPIRKRWVIITTPFLFLSFKSRTLGFRSPTVRVGFLRGDHVDEAAAGGQRYDGEEEAGVHEGRSAEARNQRPYSHREGRQLQDGASEGPRCVGAPPADADRRVLDRRWDRDHRLHRSKRTRWACNCLPFSLILQNPSWRVGTISGDLWMADHLGLVFEAY